MPNLPTPLNPAADRVHSELERRAGEAGRVVELPESMRDALAEAKKREAEMSGSKYGLASAIKPTARHVAQADAGDSFESLLAAPDPGPAESVTVAGEGEVDFIEELGNLFNLGSENDKKIDE